MPTFATVTPSGHVTLWNEASDGTTTVSSHPGAVDPSELPEDLDVWSFDVETSIETGSAFNAARQPYVDADDRPVWKGARMRFVRISHHVNVEGGTGRVTSFDMYGGVRIESDAPLKIWGRDFCEGIRTDVSIHVSDYEKHPELGGVRRLSSGVGDPFEHGRQQTYLRIDQDPREVCTPVSRSFPKP